MFGLLLVLSVLPLKAASGGTVIAWGSNFSGQRTAPAGLSGVVAIAAGFYHTMALKSDGTVTAWGDNTYGQTNAPSDLTEVAAISAGWEHSVALKRNGTVVVWGANTYGQLDVPVGLSGVKAIVAGGFHTVALKSNGTVVVWGRNLEGQTIEQGLSGVTAVAAGFDHTVVLNSDGVTAWPGNRPGIILPPSGLTGVTSVAAGASFTVALKSIGTVVAWGYNNYGQVSGTPTLGSPFTATANPVSLGQQPFVGVTAIAAGWNHTVALKSDGTVVVWGLNSYGQTNVPVGLSRVVAVAAGADHTVALVGPAPPTVSTSSTGSGLTIIWPETAMDYRLESASSLVPTVTWNNVTGTFQTNAGSISIVVPMTGTQKFYRLIKP